METSRFDEILRNLYVNNTSIFFSIISQKKEIQLTWIELFKDNLNWLSISKYSKHFNNECFLNKYRDYIYWEILPDNESINWNSSLYKIYKSNTNQENVIYPSRLNGIVSWDENFFEEYFAEVDWFEFSSRRDVKWTIEFLKKYEEKLNWDQLSSNESLPWSDSLIELFIDKWLWETVENDGWYPTLSILKNSAITWNIELIEKYSENISWYEISSSCSVVWSLELFEKFSDKLNWQLLSKNESIKWSEELIFKFINRWDLALVFSNKSFLKLDWTSDFKTYILNSILNERYIVNYNFLSKVTEITWSDELVGKFGSKLNWHALSKNPSLNLSEEFIIKNIEKFARLTRFTYEDDRMLCSGLSCNESIPWSYNLLKTKSYLWDWRYLSGNCSLPWSIEFIKSFKDCWEWSKIKEYNFFNLKTNELIGSEKILLPCSLSTNTSLPWSLKLLDSFYDKWDWKELSQNKSIPWHEDLIDFFFSKWDWKELSSNLSIKWNEVLISKYMNCINWRRLSANTSVDWNIELIDRYYSKWDWNKLSSNESINHNILFSEKYIHKLDFSYFDIEWNIEKANMFCDLKQSIPYSLSIYLQKSTNIDIIEDVINEILLNKHLQ